MPVRIKDGIIPYTGGQGIEITNNHVINVLLREMNNLIHVNGDRELYVDLQLPSGIKPADTFPVGVTTGKILQEDGWQQSGLILNWKTTSGDYVRLIYANDGNLYIDKGQGIRINISTWEEDLTTYKVFYVSNPDAYQSRAIEQAQAIYDYLHLPAGRPVVVKSIGADFMSPSIDVTNNILYIGGWDNIPRTIFPYPMEEYILLTCPFDANGHITSVTLTHTAPVAQVYMSTTQPVAYPGVLWYDTANSALKIFDGSNRQTI